MNNVSKAITQQTHVLNIFVYISGFSVSEFHSENMLSLHCNSTFVPSDAHQILVMSVEKYTFDTVDGPSVLASLSNRGMYHLYLSNGAHSSATMCMLFSVKNDMFYIPKKHVKPIILIC